MTITNETARRRFLGANTTGPFPVGMDFDTINDLAVVKRLASGSDVPLLANIGFTLAGSDLYTTAQVAIGEALAVSRKTPATQEADYVENDGFPADSHEKALDKLTMLVQEDRDALTRTLTFPPSDAPGINLTLPTSTQRAGVFLGFGATGEPLALSGTGSDPDFRGDVAAGNGELLGFNAGYPSAVQRTMWAKAKDIVHLRDWGSANGGDLAGDAILIQKAFDECPLGEMLHMPPVIFHMKAPTDGSGASVTLRRQIDIQGNRAQLYGFFGADVTHNLLDVKISEAAYGAGDVRLTTVERLGLGFISGGNDTVLIQNAAPMAANLEMFWYRCAISSPDVGAGYALHIKGDGNQLHTFAHSQFYNGIFFDNCNDGNKILYSQIVGPRLGFLVNLAPGSWRTVIAHNVITTRDGWIIIHAAGELDFLYNQCEQIMGANTNPYDSGFVIDTYDPAYVNKFQAKRINVVGNNFGGGLNIGSNVFLGTGLAGLGVDDIYFDLNTFMACAVADMRIVDNQVRGTRWGPNNMLRGNRGGAAITDPPGTITANTLDEADLAIIVDLGTGTYGVWQPSTKFTGLGSGWSYGTGFRWRKELDDELTWEGFLNVGVKTLGTVIGIMEDGFRTKNDTVLPVGTDAGAGLVKLIAATGEIKVESIPASATKLYMEGLRYRVKGRTFYNPSV